MQIVIGINGTRLATDRAKGTLRVVRIDADQPRPEILAIFTPDRMSQAIDFAEKYAAKFGHVELRAPLYIGPRF